MVLKNDGYTLLSNLYKDSGHKLKYTCSDGHKYLIYWGDRSKGSECLPYLCNMKCIMSHHMGR